MSLVRPQGTLTFTPSTSEDVVSYVLFQEPEGTPLSYESPNVDVGLNTTIQLPVVGLPGIEGSVVYGIAAKDGVGNLSDITQATPFLVDITPPIAPAELVYSPPT